MIVGIHQRPGDLVVNVCKVKAVNNIRSATKSISEGIVPPIEIGLDQAVEYIQDDELVEVSVSSNYFNFLICTLISIAMQHEYCTVSAIHASELTRCGFHLL
jgi:hypothetical protein